MTNEEFDRTVQATIKRIVPLLQAKGSEYAPNAERFQNFIEAARFLGSTKEEALLFFVTKHLVSLRDFVRRQAAGEVLPSAKWQERTDDIIIYMFLLSGMISEREKGEKE